MPKSSVRPGRARLRDIAEQAGVSINTVSRALNRKPEVSAATRAHVEGIAKRLGYAPNVLARSLVIGRTQTVGVIVTDCTDPFYAVLIRAVEAVTSELGFGLLLATSSDQVEAEQKALRMLTERQVDGVLLTAVDAEAPHVAALLRGPIPTVLLVRQPRRFKGPSVNVDNVAGTRLAMRHLIGLGHRRIAHITLERRGINVVEREANYRAELEAAGIGVDERMIVRAPPTFAGGRAAARAILALDPRPTAVFAFRDSQAIGAMVELRDHGVAVPAEMSVVGFDDIEVATLVSPALTTVAPPIDEIGRRGAHILVDLIQRRGRRPPPPMLIAPTLKLRGSTAPPGGRAAGRSRRRAVRDHQGPETADRAPPAGRHQGR